MEGERRERGRGEGGKREATAYCALLENQPKLLRRNKAGNTVLADQS